MEQHNLSEQQYEQLVDYLHRWGLDSPELIAEMADHFSEKAVELMAAGHSWETVLKSFKTKKIYLELRRAQAAYTAVVEKSVWRLMLHQLFAALHPKYLLLYLICGVLSHYLIANEFTVRSFQYLLGVKNLLVVVFTIYIMHHHKDYKLLVREKYAAFGALFCFDYAILLNHTGAVFDNSVSLRGLSASGDSLLFATVFITLSVFCNVVAWRTFKTMRSYVDNTHPGILKVLHKI